MDLYTLLFEFGQHLIMYLADNAGYGRVRESICRMHVHVTNRNHHDDCGEGITSNCHLAARPASPCS